jgi:hypothetical protein
MVAALAVAATLAGTIGWAVGASAAAKADAQVGHMVFFTLNERTPEAAAKLVAACDKYLNGHPGTVYYSAGVLAQDLTREVNDRDFDVALHVVFDSKAAHDAYQDAPRHLQFIEENKPTWAKVRVFDSYINPAK